MFKRTIAIVFAAILPFGCVSFEELKREEIESIREHKKVVAECKAKRKAYYQWLQDRKTLLTPSDIKHKAAQFYGKCFEENLPGLIFHDIRPTTHLDIRGKKSLVFLTGDDHLLKRFLERLREWDLKLGKGKEPWDGYWFQYNEALVKWENFYKDKNP